MKLAAIVAKTWFSASFPKNRFPKIRPGPGNQNHLFQFFIQPKTKKTQGADWNPAQPRPETPSLWDGHRKSNTFFHQPCPFSVFSYSFFMENSPTKHKTSPHSPLPTKNNNCIVFRLKKPSANPKQATIKTIPIFKGRQCVWNP